MENGCFASFCERFASFCEQGRATGHVKINGLASF